MTRAFQFVCIVVLLLTITCTGGVAQAIYGNVHDLTSHTSSSLLADSAYWHEQASTQKTEALIKQIQGFNTYPDVPAEGEWVLYSYQVNSTTKVPYLVYVPENYNHAKKTPLYVFLHGGVNRPDFADPQAIPRMMSNVLQQAIRQNAFIIYPFARQDFNWLVHYQAFGAILAEVREVKKLYNIDDNKVYIGGHSDGARGAFWFALNHSHPFAAVFGICYEPLLLNMNTHLRNLSNSRFYGISAINDHLFSNQQVNEIVCYGRSAGANWEQLNVQGQHNLPFASPDSIYPLFNQVLSRTRNPLPKHINWETADVCSGRFAWLSITALDTLQPAKSWHKAYQLTLTWPNGGAGEQVNLTPRRAGAVNASIKGNTVIIKTSRVKALQFLALNGLLDYTKPVIFQVNDEPAYEIMIKPDHTTLINEFLNSADRQSIVLSKVVISIR